MTCRPWSSALPSGLAPPVLVKYTIGWALTSQASGPLEAYVATSCKPPLRDSFVSHPVGWAPAAAG